MTELPPLPATTWVNVPHFTYTSEAMRAYAADAVKAERARLLDANEKLAADNANLRTVMVAAAEEISAHWPAYCDDEGYGPANLLRRLEDGIPSQYGYTAGAFAELKAENARLLDALEEAQKDVARLDWLDENPDRLKRSTGYLGSASSWTVRDTDGIAHDFMSARAAIDAAIAANKESA